MPSSLVLYNKIRKGRLPYATFHIKFENPRPNSERHLFRFSLLYPQKTIVKIVLQPRLVFLIFFEIVELWCRYLKFFYEQSSSPYKRIMKLSYKLSKPISQIRTRTKSFSFSSENNCSSIEFLDFVHYFRKVEHHTSCQSIKFLRIFYSEVENKQPKPNQYLPNESDIIFGLEVD